MGWFLGHLNTPLVGFFRDGRWFVYDDAYLIGSGTDVPANAAFWGDWQGFGGGYFEGMKGCAVGTYPMFNALRVLSNPNSSSTDTRLALYQFIVAIPEAVRFPDWLRYYVSLLRCFRAERIQDHCVFSQRPYFNDWSSVCKRVRKGAAAFIAGDGLDTYEALVQIVYVLLSRPPQDEL